METWESRLGYNGIVVGTDIRKLSGQLISSPIAIDDAQYQSTSFDMRIGAIITASGVVKQDSVDFRPGIIATLLTSEELFLPLDMAGTVYPKIHLAEEGLLMLTIGHIDPGFRGVLTIKMVNLRRDPYKLAIGKLMVTVVFEKLSQAVSPQYVKRYLTRKEREDSSLDLMERVSPAGIPVLIRGQLEEMLPNYVNARFVTEEQRVTAIEGRMENKVLVLEERFVQSKNLGKEISSLLWVRLLAVFNIIVLLVTLFAAVTTIVGYLSHH